MSDKPYTFDESPEETSQSTLRSDAIYGGVGEEEQHNAVTGYGKPNNDHERDAVTKPQYKTKVKTQTLDIAQPETKLPQQVTEDVWEVDTKKRWPVVRCGNIRVWRGFINWVFRI
eukprot:TRINITY_DN6145_c0_g1_i1.p2 TRINITY_DN6145_c0_g1~~TRINITY_DN6145_c0_g1_i1.p2  ORF type:complete len:115 (+),score=3.43 TRINITY_DN6145_c0_g1_i1:119-463(+)